MAAPRETTTGSTRRPHYFADGQRINLAPSTHSVAVRLAPGLEGAELTIEELEHSTVQDLPTQGLRLHSLHQRRTVDDMAGLMARLRADPGIDLLAPVFETPGAQMIVTDRFIAQLAPATELVELEELNDRYGVEFLERSRWDERTLILRVREGDALATANVYHQLPQIAYAHPDFVRVQHAKASRFGGFERTVIDPEGRRLPPGTPVPKGAVGFRVLEIGRSESELRSADARRRAPLSEWRPEPTTIGTVIKETLRVEDFEGPFPNIWQLNGTPTWGEVTFRRMTGNWSGYCAGSGVPPPGPYPNFASSFMQLFPFSLAQALDARVSLRAWIRTEADYDRFFVGAAGGFLPPWTGYFMSGDWATPAGGSGFAHFALNFTYDFGRYRLTGEDWVGFAISFSSDPDIALEGVYVDDIVFEQITGGYESITDDELDHLQWHLSNNGQRFGAPGADIRAPEAWAVSEGSDTITLAVVDDGFNISHPDLDAKLVPGYDATGGGNFAGFSATLSAGVAAATTNNATGIAGVAPLAKIMPVRVRYLQTTQDSWVADGIRWAAEHGADILTNGWEGGLPSTTITNAIRSARNTGRGGKGAMVIVGTGDDDGAVGYPANLSDTFAVGALSLCDERKSATSCDGALGWGSNFGTEVDVTAPGVHLYSTYPVGFAIGEYHPNFGGTASAAAVVAGVAALVLGHDPSLTAEQLEDRLRATADDLGPAGFDQETGYGRVNALQALLEPSPNGTLSVSLAGTGTGTVISVPSGISCGGVCEATYALASLVELYGHPALGSQLDGWSGHADCSDGSVTMVASLSCTATFSPCAGNGVVNLPAQVVNTKQTFEACDTIQAGAGGFRIEAPGDVTFSVGNSVVLENGFEIDSGGVFSVVMGLPTGP